MARPSSSPDVFTVLSLAGVVATLIAVAYLFLRANDIFGAYPLMGG
ncbi:MAG: hypothetical protein AAF656_02715 [Planctomycetota bacterium]